MATTSLLAQEMLSRGLQSAVDAAAGAADAVKEGEGGFVESHFGWFVFIVTGVISIVLVVSVQTRELFWRKYGVDVCPGTGRRGRNQDVTNQIITDQEMAQELQRQVNEELREQERLEKRKERRTWYESYIQPYTMEVQAKDIFYGDEHGLSISHKQSSQRSMVPFLKKSLSAADLDDEAEELESPEVDKAAMNAAAITVMDLEKGFNKESERTASSTDSSDCGDEEYCNHSPSLPNEDAETHAYLRLPGKDADGKPRCVEANCSICLGAYEPGDKVVWSGLNECKHCFHDECILPWLSKGKKRCPMCRQWFVPGTKIEDQKAALETTATTTTQVLAETTTATIQQVDEPTGICSLSLFNATDDLAMARTALATTTQEGSDCGGLHFNAGPMHDDVEMGVPPTQIVANPAA